jgi:hypothetical protein
MPFICDFLDPLHSANKYFPLQVFASDCYAITINFYPANFSL